MKHIPNILTIIRFIFVPLIVTCLALNNYLLAFIFFTVSIKEVIMIAGASFLYGKQLVVSSKWYGKLTTVLIYIAVVSSFAIRIFDLHEFDIYIYCLAVIFAIFSLFSYIFYFYGKGYLPNKEELKKTAEIKEFKKK